MGSFHRRKVLEPAGLEHVVVATPTGNRLIGRSGFVQEASLQSLILTTPELMGPIGNGLKFIPIGWEVPLGGGSLDLLFLDSEGMLTLVETKLKTNYESRRQVIGQILEYAAYASELSFEEVTAGAANFLTGSHAPRDIAGSRLEEAISIRLEWDRDEEAERTAKVDGLLAKLEASLAEGRLRIVCGVDERVESLERLVRYLSAHSDLQVVLLQVNRFAVDDQTSVLIPYLHGDTGHQPGREVRSSQRFTITTLIDAFPEGPQREAVRMLISTAQQAGASFEPGPSGTGIRVRTPAHNYLVSVAWIFAPGKPGWMRARDISFGHPLDYPTTHPDLLALLEQYYSDVVALGGGEDASGKGMHAVAFTPELAAAMVEDLSALLDKTIREVAALTPEA